ncbi:hypothetical protein GCM10023405_27330 [Streptomonospora salina]
MARPRQRRSQHRPDPSGADDADPQPRGPLGVLCLLHRTPFQSTRVPDICAASLLTARGAQTTPPADGGAQ